MDNRNAVEMTPELASQDFTPMPLVVKKKGVYDQSFKMDIVAAPQSIPFSANDCTRPDKSVKVFFHVGTPSHCIGQNGDFYLEEETNVLYGPKVKGIWPEDGVKVSGPIIRKRTREAQPVWSIDLDEFVSTMKKDRAQKKRAAFRLITTRRLARLSYAICESAKVLLLRLKELMSLKLEDMGF